jgi:hypothetical protein
MAEIFEGPVQDEQKEPEVGETWIDTKDGEACIILGVAEDEEEGRLEVSFHKATEKYEHSTFFQDIDAFLERFTFDPLAAEKRESELQEVTKRLGDITEETQHLEVELKQLGTGSGKTAEESTSTAVALTDEGGLEMADQMKKTVAKIRNQVQRNALRAKEEAAKMNSLIALNVLAVKAKMEGIQAMALREAEKLTKMVKAAEEVVWTFNLYLGKEETIVCLRDGEPAAKNEKIAIRQLVLYMDEESALFSEEGGLDFRTMEEFDNWIMESPEHLNQVLPNTRGIVAIKPRRTNKEYSGDPIVDAALNKMNKHTYFLIRNGERLFRIDTDLEVTGTLFPLENEFAELFEQTIHDWDAPDSKRKIKPGDSEYMEAMEKAQGNQKHYMRVFLFLQGLLDRTTVFHPFEVPRVNVFDMVRQDEHILFVSDAETGRQLGDGRPSFDKWLTEINKQLEVGMRVIGIFSSGRYSRGDHPRTHPAGMSRPSDTELHTITRKERSRVWFLYPRTDPVYSRPWWDNRDNDEDLRRVSIWFDMNEDHWIAFDLATVEDMEYYLRSRQNRRAYQTMFPILKRAIELKKKEAEQEAPFRAALVGALMRDHKFAFSTEAQEAVDDLVRWWKYKNKTHRALLSDDEKASRMILSEYKRRLAVTALREKLAAKFSVTAELIHACVPDALAVYHKNYNEFVVFRPENAFNVFVREENWVLARGKDLKKVGERRWVTTNTTRIDAWLPLTHGQRWEEWIHNADPKKHLTDEEATAVLDHAIKKIKEAYATKEGRKQCYWVDPGEGEIIFVPLALYLKNNEWLYWFRSRRGRVPKNKLTGTWSRPTIMRASIEWYRNDKGIAEPRIHIQDTRWTESPFCPPEKYNDFFEKERKFHNPIFFDEGAVKELNTEIERYRRKETVHKRLHEKVTQAVAEVTQAMKDHVLNEQFLKFQDDYGDPDLWEAHKANLKMPYFRPTAFEAAVPYVVERGIPLEGMTVGQVLEKAKELGWKGTMEPDEWHRNKNTVYLPPMDYTIRNVVPTVEEEDESDDD